jgi:hypothetical protein
MKDARRINAVGLAADAGAVLAQCPTGMQQISVCR